MPIKSFFGRLSGGQNRKGKGAASTPHNFIVESTFRYENRLKPSMGKPYLSSPFSLTDRYLVLAQTNGKKSFGVSATDGGAALV